MQKFYAKIISCFILLISLSACVQPMTIVGETSDAINPAEVKIYISKRPLCDYQTIGHLRINGGYYSQASLLKEMQRQAAEVGADGLLVLETRRLDILEFIGTASAIRCLTDQ